MAADLALRRIAVAPIGLADRLQTAWPAALAFVAIGAVGAARGGYFATSWGWTALAFAWVAALALVVRSAARLSLLERLFVGGFALFALWILASVLWSQSAAQPIRELERVVVYAVAALAVLLVTRGRSYRGLLGGAWASIAVMSLYALATRLLPDRYGQFDSLTDYRLSQPVGYWNGLGILAVLGVLLAIGLAARGRSCVIRALAGASTVVLLPTIYFTFSRGAWVALGVGLIAAIAVDPRRLQLITSALALAPACALAVWFSSNADGLVLRGSTFGEAIDDGHRLAWTLLLLAVLAGVVGAALAPLERVPVPRNLRIAYGAALGLVAVGAVVGVFAIYGGPQTIARDGVDALTRSNPPGFGGQNLEERLFSLSSPGRSQHWRVAWDEYLERPVLGWGAGSFERRWLAERPTAGVVRDAHNLYLETLMELGPVGLALLTLTLGLPVVVAFRARRRGLVPAAAGAYVAFLAHAGIDWDWELPAVTLAAIVCGAAILAAARTPGVWPISPRLRVALLAGVVAVGAFSFVGLVGNRALADSRSAERSSDLARAESQARKARTWAWWSAEPWDALADVAFERDDLPAARAALLEAVERDRGDWGLWYDLGVASKGREQQRAYERAAELNPLSANVEVLRILGVLPKLPAGGR